MPDPYANGICTYGETRSSGSGCIKPAGHDGAHYVTPGDTDDQGDADGDVFELIAGIASRLRDATDEGEYHAVGLIYDLAKGRTTIADAREQLAEITFRHV